MVVLIVLSGTVLHAVQSNALESAVRRQLQMKAEYTYHLLANAMVENSGRSYLRTLAEGLLENRTEGPCREVAPILEEVRPHGFVVEVRMEREDGGCVSVRIPENAGEPGDVFTFSGRFALVSAGENPEDGMNVRVFEVRVSLVRAA